MKRLLLLLILVSPFVKAQTTNPAPECAHEYDDGAAPKVHYIYSVQIGNFVNVSGTTQQPFPHYIYYNNMTAGPFVIGQTYSYTIQIDTMGSNKYVYIWNDWNANGYYEFSEVMIDGPIPGGVSSVTGAFSIPNMANPGTRRMRIYIAEDSTQSPLAFCTTTLDWGECEDYDFQVSFTADITDVDNTANGINVYPNPSSDHLIIQSKEKDIQSVSIYNISGQKVFEREFAYSEKEQLNVAELKSGIYTVSVQSTDGSVSRKLFVKE